VRIEFIVPVAFGILLCLIGAGLLFDAWTPDELIVSRERRRRPRTERSRRGEALVGLGVACMGAAFIGRDEWKYRTLAVLVGFVLLLLGVLFNARFLAETISNRGKLRRGAPASVTAPERDVTPAAAVGDAGAGESPTPPTPATGDRLPEERLRIR
jgi:hypothetical protein